MEKSFLKWAGGKYRVLPVLLPILDGLTDSNIKNQTFIEPFMGSGTVFLNFNSLNSFVLADKNKILISLFQYLQNEPEVFIKKAKKFFNEKNNTKEKYYELVKKFNGSNLKTKTEMFIYLNKHCFNGLMRFNNSGNFNTPYGQYAGPSFPMENLLAMVDKIKKSNVSFIALDFRNILEDAKFGDIIYCDPPYVDAFNQYGKGGFTMEDQMDLVVLAKQAAIRGAKVVISNHYNKETKNLYKEASYWEIFDVKRSISSKSSTRGDKKEIIAVYDF